MFTAGILKTTNNENPTNGHNTLELVFITVTEGIYLNRNTNAIIIIKN